jgi:hypothetical protein
MARKAYRIIAHHEHDEKAAELCVKEQVVAIGWSRAGNIEKMGLQEIKAKLKNAYRSNYSKKQRAVDTDAGTMARFRDRLERGDLVLLYVRPNTIAAVGNTRNGNYRYNTRNGVGNPAGTISYPNQRRVKWWPRPRNFHREYLPSRLSRVVAGPGTLRELSCNVKKLERTLGLIPDRATQEKAATFETQNDVKEYLKKHMRKLAGLRLVRSEFPTPRGPFDFLCRDKDNVPVVVEIADGLEGDTTEIGELLKYKGAYSRKARARKVRGILVARQFNRDAREAARATRDVTLYTCELIPTFRRKG